MTLTVTTTLGSDAAFGGVLASEVRTRTCARRPAWLIQRAHSMYSMLRLHHVEERLPFLVGDRVRVLCGFFAGSTFRRRTRTFYACRQAYFVICGFCGFKFGLPAKCRDEMKV